MTKKYDYLPQIGKRNNHLNNKREIIQRLEVHVTKDIDLNSIKLELDEKYKRQKENACRFGRLEI